MANRTLIETIKRKLFVEIFLGNTENAIKIQISATLMAALILQIIHQMGAKKWAFSVLVSLIKYHLHSDIKRFKFFHNPTACFNTITKKILDKPQTLKPVLTNWGLGLPIQRIDTYFKGFQNYLLKICCFYWTLMI